MPMAMLEDALVPVYFYHRYQIEAATKLVGGMYYNYALRGDGQLVTKMLSKEEQRKALNAIVDCIDPKLLMIPDRIAALIPPRPSGYGSSRELFRQKNRFIIRSIIAGRNRSRSSLLFFIQQRTVEPYGAAGSKWRAGCFRNDSNPDR